MSDHRCIQQNQFRLIMQIIQAWADRGKTGRYDARNEATCKYSEKIMELMEKEGLYLPYI